MIDVAQNEWNNLDGPFTPPPPPPPPPPQKKQKKKKQQQQQTSYVFPPFCLATEGNGVLGPLASA